MSRLARITERMVEYLPGTFARRGGFLTAALFALATWFGLIADQPGPVSPWLWGAATGLCVAAAIRPQSEGMWLLSGATLIVAALSRTVTIIMYHYSDKPGVFKSGGLTVVGAAFCTMTAIGVVFLWHWLRPRGQ